jgi:nicotinamidase-related amidase
MEGMVAREVSDVVLCGIEAHVCVTQSCLDLLDAGMRVFVVADAVASRTAANFGFGIDRMRRAGAIVVSTEMILFELMGTAGAPEFKELQRLVK